MQILDRTFYGNGARAWLVAIAVMIIAFLVLRVVRQFAGRHLNSIAGRTNNEIDDVAAKVLDSTKGFFLLFLAVYIGSRTLTLAPNALSAVRVVVVSAIILQFAFWGTVAIESTIRHQSRRTLAEDDPATATTFAALGFIGRILLYSVLLLMGLANIGIEIAPLIAGLGVGGIAVALAVQNILGDLFASLSIVLDKPFVISDFIIVGEQAGTVEHIGLKTTRVRSLSGEQLVFSNSDLLGSRIRNFKRMYERRILFTIGVTYETDYAQIEAIPGIIREIVEAQQPVRFDRSHFKAYGDSSLDFETVYYVLVPEYSAYMDVQQAINLALFRRFESEGIEFAYPTRRVVLEHAEIGATSERTGAETR
jgi:small-conductance mechanosensitive channel